jgi:hypothetical protein
MDKKTIELALENIKFDHQMSINKAIDYVQFLNKLGYTSITDPQSFVKSMILNTPLSFDGRELAPLNDVM